jgi:hypothetical protein
MEEVIEAGLRRAAMCLAFVVAAEAPALAGSPIAIAYSADRGCPAAPAFLAQLRARAADVELVDASAAAPRFSVVVGVDA